MFKSGLWDIVFDDDDSPETFLYIFRNEGKSRRRFCFHSGERTNVVTEKKPFSRCHNESSECDGRNPCESRRTRHNREFNGIMRGKDGMTRCKHVVGCFLIDLTFESLVFRRQVNSWCANHAAVHFARRLLESLFVEFTCSLELSTFQRSLIYFSAPKRSSRDVSLRVGDICEHIDCNCAQIVFKVVI